MDSHQNAWFNLGSFNKGFETEYKIHNPLNGVYFFVLEGAFDVEGTILGKRDGIAVWDALTINLKTLSDDAEILIMEVPL